LKLLRGAVFTALVLATVAAFFVTQHLKVTTPLINGFPRPAPAAFNPISGRICRSADGKPIDYRRVRFSFYLQRRSDDVGLYVISQRTGEIVATVAADRHMRVNTRNPDGDFSWNGREGDGNGPYAPDGTYYFRIALQQENRTFDWTQDPFQIITTPPHPQVVGVRVTRGPAPIAGPAVISPPAQSLTIHFKPGHYRSAFIDVYRTTEPGTSTLVKSFRVNGARGVAIWDGRIQGRPAATGTYLVGMSVTDQACNLGRYPIVVPPPPGSTPHAGVTVRYLGVQPSLDPIGAGSIATIPVYSSAARYRWALSRVGRRKPVLRGSAAGSSSAAVPLPLRFRVPPLAAALYELAVRGGGTRALAPLIASAEGRRAAARVLVVLPALAWQGGNPVDDDGDGLPNTLSGGDRIDLQRPLAAGPPPGLIAQAALLAYLDSHHLAYQLTSDIALSRGVGPRLASHSGLILDGAFTWLPPRLGPQLLAFVGDGGHVVSIGQGSMLRTAPITATTAGPPGSAAASDPFGARPGRHVETAGALVTVISDPLRIFTLTGPVLSGFGGYQSIAPPAGRAASLAGLDATMPGVTGFSIGRGTVVEVGLDGFQRSLAHNISAQELLARLWQILSG
jgi:hypothetical protein